MNRRFYHSLMLSQSFFHTFEHIRYRGVPVARAMFYSFHRKTLRWKGGGRPRKNWAAYKKKLYAQLVKSEPIFKVNYSLRRKGRILYTPEAASGIPHTRGKSIVCGIRRSDISKFSACGAKFVLPGQAALNKRAFKLIYRAFVKKVRSKKCPRYFKQRKFLRWVHSELPSVMRTIDGCLRLFNQYNIKGVVVHSSVHSLGYVMTHMGKQRNLPTITLQYGINDDYQLMSTYSAHYVAWGESHKKRLTQFGVPASKIKSIGAARFDPIFQGKWYTKAQLARSLRISRKKQIFFYPEQPLAQSINRKALLTIIRALQPYRSKVVLLVKPHPKQTKMSLPSKTLRRYKFVKLLKRNRTPLYHLISGSNAVFVQFSTVGIEAILLNRPLISIALFRNTHKHEFTYYAASRSLTSARNQTQLNRIMSKLIRSKSYRNAVLRKQQKYRKLTYEGTVSADHIQRFIASKCHSLAHRGSDCMIGIIGASGHAKVIAELFAAASPHAKLIFFSSNPNQSSPFFAPYDHYTDLPQSLVHHVQSILHWHVAIGNIDVRKKKTAALEQLKCRLISAIHPTAIISPTSTIGAGSSVMAGAIMNSETVIGKGCIINTGAIIDHDCHIGDFTNIGPGSRLAGGVTVGDQTELGTGTIVIPNVTIGKNCTIGAGSVVIRDIPDGSRAVGVPAKRLD